MNRQNSFAKFFIFVNIFTTMTTQTPTVNCGGVSLTLKEQSSEVLARSLYLSNGNIFKI